MQPIVTRHSLVTRGGLLFSLEMLFDVFEPKLRWNIYYFLLSLELPSKEFFDCVPDLYR